MSLQSMTNQILSIGADAYQQHQKTLAEQAKAKAKIIKSEEKKKLAQNRAQEKIKMKQATKVSPKVSAPSAASSQVESPKTPSTQRMGEKRKARRAGKLRSSYGKPKRKRDQ